MHFKISFEISPFPEVWNMLDELLLEPFYVACFESCCLENFSHVTLLYSYEKKKVLWLKASLPIGMKIIVSG